MADRLHSLLGLCKKAGHLVMGFDEVASAMDRGGAKGPVCLVALAADLSPKSAKEIVRLADRQKIDSVRLNTSMDELWYVLGKRAGILAVTERGLAGKIAAIARHNEEDSSI